MGTLIHQASVEQFHGTTIVCARRLATVMERLLEDVSFDATQLGGSSIHIDAAYVDERLKALSANEDLSRYIL